MHSPDGTSFTKLRFLSFAQPCRLNARDSPANLGRCISNHDRELRGSNILQTSFMPGRPFTQSTRQSPFSFSYLRVVDVDILLLLSRIRTARTSYYSCPSSTSVTLLFWIFAFSSFCLHLRLARLSRRENRTAKIQIRIRTPLRDVDTRCECGGDGSSSCFLRLLSKKRRCSLGNWIFSLAGVDPAAAVRCRRVKYLCKR